MSVKSNPELPSFCVTTLCDWGEGYHEVHSVVSLRPLLGASTFFDQVDLLAFEIPIVGGDTSAVSIDNAVAQSINQKLY